MHSSRMRTGRSLTIFQGLLFPGGGCTCLEGGGGGCTCLEGGCTCLEGGVPAWRGGVPAWRGGCTCLEGGVPARGGPGQVLPPPVDRITDACKNITLAKTSFRPVIIRRDVIDRWLLLNMTDPADELQWLISILQYAENNHERVKLNVCDDK